MSSDILKKTGSMLLVVFLCAAQAAAQVKAADTDLDDAVIGVGETTTLSIKITSGSGELKQVKVPRVPGLEITYSGMQRSFQFINGKTWQGVTLTYTITGEKKGNYTIPPLVFEQGSAFVKSREVSLLVRAGASGSREGGSSSVKPEVALSKTKVFLGEPVLVRYYLLSSGSGSVNIEAIDKQPETRSFVVNRVEEARGDDVVSREGGEFIRSHLYTFALFPTQTGKVEAGGGSVIMNAERRGGFFGMMDRKRLLFDTLPLEVLPLPEKGKPDDFPGNVGSFTMKLEYDRNTMKAFNEKKVKIVIEGQGNLFVIARPAHEPGDGDVRVLVEESGKDITVSGDTLKGKAVFTATIIPEKEGPVKAGTFIFSYFNPGDRSYHTLKSEEIVLDVKGGGKQGPHMEFDSDEKGSVDFNPLYIALIVLLAVGVVTAIVVWEKRRYRIIVRAQDEQVVEPEEKRESLKDLEGELAAAVFKKDSALFFRAMDKILAQAPDGSPAAEKMKAAGLDAASLRERIYTARFGGGVMSEADMKSLADSLKKSGLFS